MAARVGIGKDAVAKIWADACMHVWSPGRTARVSAGDFSDIRDIVRGLR
jgi:hypothetical protein